jgi:hypothetical protein
MGKASRQRRQKKEHDRQRQRAAQGHRPKDGAGTGAESAFRSWPGGDAGFGGDSEPRRAQSPQQQVAALITKALEARVDRPHAYIRYLDQLSSDRGAGWAQLVSRTLVEFLRMSVTAAWRAGWQPAELARHVGRETSPAHTSLAADMIASEMRGYAVATVDPRWAAQVTGLSALTVLAGTGGAQAAAISWDGAWWGSDDKYLGAWRAARGEFDPTVGVATALETLQVLLHLRALEKLMPLPGTAPPAPPGGHPATAAPSEPGAAGTADERMLSRIRALLAKAESTEFPEEAEALSARAQELMAKYSIDHALLAAQAGSKEEPGGRRIAVDNPYEGPKATLLNTVAEANRCRAIWSKDVGLVTVVGFPADLDAIELLFTSLLVQANTAMIRAGGKKDEYGRSRTRSFRQSFLVSYAIRIGERLAEAAGHAEQEAVASQEAARRQPAGEGPVIGAGGPGTDLVPFLAARREAVNDAVDELFGSRLTTSRAVRATDAEGWVSGRAAADLASLHNRSAVADAG